jgi:hypothetical protein
MTRGNAAIIVGGIAGIILLPACMISPILVLGCATVMTVSIPFMDHR